MRELLSLSTQGLQHFLDLLPHPVLVVDDDVRVLAENLAAKALVLTGTPAEEEERFGDLMACLQALHLGSKGCGTTERCNECVVRNSVGEASSGRGVQRARHKLAFMRGGKRHNHHVLVTASSLEPGPDGQRRTALILEVVDQQVKLESILPICSYCKKIRDSADYWQSVESYLHTRIDVAFSHSICDECLEKHFPGREEP